MKCLALVLGSAAAFHAPAAPRSGTALYAVEPPPQADPQKAARRQALLDASARAAARIEAIRGGPRGF